MFASCATTTRKHGKIRKEEIGISVHHALSSPENMMIKMFIPPKNGKIALQTPRTCRLSTFYYCQVVNRALLRLLSTYILVLYRVLANYNIELSNILYHRLLSMASFHFCETYFLHVKPFVVNKTMITKMFIDNKEPLRLVSQGRFGSGRYGRSSPLQLLQCVAVCCSVLQRVAACCSALQGGLSPCSLPATLPPRD